MRERGREVDEGVMKMVVMLARTKKSKIINKSNGQLAEWGAPLLGITCRRQTGNIKQKGCVLNICCWNIRVSTVISTLSSACTVYQWVEGENDRVTQLIKAVWSCQEPLWPAEHNIASPWRRWHQSHRSVLCNWLSTRKNIRRINVSDKSVIVRDQLAMM